MAGFIMGVGRMDLVKSDHLAEYTRWRNMLMRCYKPNYNTTDSYRDCYVCGEWLTFSIFRDWLVSQLAIHGSLDGLQLDKDIITPDNKLYSPEHCSFVSKRVNCFVNTNNHNRGGTPIGVHKRNVGVYVAKCKDPFSSRRTIHVGQYKTASEAHEAWRAQKHILSCMLADTVCDQRVANALRIKYKREYHVV